MIMEATHLGLMVHQMAGFDAEKARLAFAIPEDYDPMAAIAIGYIGNAEDLPPALRERHLAKRSRKLLTTISFDGRWDAPVALAGMAMEPSSG